MRPVSTGLLACLLASALVAVAGQDAAVTGCLDPAADNWLDPDGVGFDPATVHDEKTCRYDGLPRVPLANEGSRAGYLASLSHCERRGGRLVSSDTLKVLGYATAARLQPREWPVYEALDRVQGMPPAYVCVGGGWQCEFPSFIRGVFRSPTLSYAVKALSQMALELLQILTWSWKTLFKSCSFAAVTEGSTKMELENTF